MLFIINQTSILHTRKHIHSHKPIKKIQVSIGTGISDDSVHIDAQGDPNLTATDEFLQGDHLNETEEQEPSENIEDDWEYHVDEDEQSAFENQDWTDDELDEIHEHDSDDHLHHEFPEDEQIFSSRQHTIQDIYSQLEETTAENEHVHTVELEIADARIIVELLKGYYGLREHDQKLSINEENHIDEEEDDYEHIEHDDDYYNEEHDDHEHDDLDDWDIEEHDEDDPWEVEAHQHHSGSGEIASEEQWEEEHHNEHGSEHHHEHGSEHHNEHGSEYHNEHHEHGSEYDNEHGSEHHEHHEHGSEPYEHGSEHHEPESEYEYSEEHHEHHNEEQHEHHNEEQHEHHETEAEAIAEGEVEEGHDESEESKDEEWDHIEEEIANDEELAEEEHTSEEGEVEHTDESTEIEVENDFLNKKEAEKIKLSNEDISSLMIVVEGLMKIYNELFLDFPKEASDEPGVSIEEQERTYDRIREFIEGVISKREVINKEVDYLAEHLNAIRFSREEVMHFYDYEELWGNLDHIGDPTDENWIQKKKILDIDVTTFVQNIKDSIKHVTAVESLQALVWNETQFVREQMNSEKAETVVEKITGLPTLIQKLLTIKFDVDSELNGVSLKLKNIKDQKKQFKTTLMDMQLYLGMENGMREKEAFAAKMNLICLIGFIMIFWVNRD